MRVADEKVQARIAAIHGPGRALNEHGEPYCSQCGTATNKAYLEIPCECWKCGGELAAGKGAKQIEAAEIPMGNANPHPQTIRMEISPFPVGDPVRLKEQKGTDPSLAKRVMYVEGVTEEGKVRCRWTKGTGLVERGEFPPEELEAVTA